MTSAYADVSFSEFLHHPAATTRRPDSVRAFRLRRRIALLLTQWRHSAEIHADPALLAALTREPEGDLGPVPVPGAAELRRHRPSQGGRLTRGANTNGRL